MSGFSIEKSFKGPVIGLDEVGRGPLAGPVVSCGCLFYSYENLLSEIPITDSKQLTLNQRQKLYIYFRKLKKERKCPRLILNHKNLSHNNILNKIEFYF